MTMEEKVDGLGECITEIKVSIAELPQKMIEKFDERYANKRVEVAIYWLAGLLFTSLIGLGVFIVEVIIKSN